MPKTPFFQLPRTSIPVLDGFRAIAILIVLLSHVGLAHIIPGKFGVTLFFFLSGYLITTILRQEFELHRTVTLRIFYFRRIVRILPPMYIAIILAIGLGLLGVIDPIDVKLLFVDLLFLSNYIQGSGLPIGLWSLAIEEHFYVIFPLIATAAFHWRGPAFCAVLCAVLCGVALVLRIIEASDPDNLKYMAEWTHTRFDSILFGSILACWNNPVIDKRDQLPPARASYLIGLALLLVCFLYRDEYFRQTLRYTIQGIALILLFNTAIHDKGYVRKFLSHVVFQWIAVLSYSLYLVHSFILLACHRMLDSVSDHVASAAGIFISFSIAVLIFVAVERPLGRWRRTKERDWAPAKESKGPAALKTFEQSGI